MKLYLRYKFLKIAKGEDVYNKNYISSEPILENV
jgi:hypothetical protein